MSHMGGLPFGGALTPTIPRPAQSHFPTPPESARAMDFFDSPRFTAMMRAMQKLLLAFIATAILCALGACARGKPKSSAHIYAGDAPTIKFSDKPETAGGNINTY